ncbi:hypothetical protein H9Q10_06800, partial [Eikenella sp. S3360]
MTYFIRHLVFLSILVLISSPVFAQLVIDNATGKLIPLRENFATSGIRPVYDVGAGKIAQQYSYAHDLSSLRSAMTGATATARLPVVATRTVPRAAVVSKVFTNARAVGLG